MSEAAVQTDDRILRLERRLMRKRNARAEAEALLERKSLELYRANQLLLRQASHLEIRVEERTRELAIAKERALMLAERDQLTGLANRMCFARVLDDAIGGALFAVDAFSLLLIDLDRFKEINDGFGHGAGDAVLQEVANRLRACVGANDIVARIGGDEFAIICSPTSSPSILGNRALAAINRSVDYHGRWLSTSCSIGIASFPSHASNVVDLQRHADMALYRSKEVGRSRLTIFHPSMMEKFNERQAMAADLRVGIASGQIEPWFQPIVDTTTRMITGVEALARWSHPRRGLLQPGAFLEIVEESGLMSDMFDAMLHASCSAAAQWIRAGQVDSLSINLSPSQFASRSLASDILGRLAALDFPPECLTVEITEEVLVKDLRAARIQLDHLAAHGVKIALDDFGAGYSNIVYLRQLPIHRIKLDRMLTAEVTEDPKTRATLRGVIEMAKGLELDVVAEGVERAEDALWLAKLGCQHLQGFYFGRPMPAKALEALPKTVDWPTPAMA